MDELGNLESSIDELLARQKLLKLENLRLQREISILSQENINLTEENRALHDSLIQEEDIRLEALRRIESLLRKIQDYDSAE